MHGPGWFHGARPPFHMHDHGHDDGGMHFGARHGHRGPPPPPPGGPFGFGPGGPGGPGFPWNFFRRGGPRARRGDIRAGILTLLGEQPRNGYQIMQELEQRSQGMWRPSPGSIYPALQQLEDEGLVVSEAKLYTLTDAGKKYLKEHKDELHAPWESMTESVGDDVAQLMQVFKQVANAAVQVAHSGNAAHVKEAKKVLVEARRALYRILAEDDGDDD